MFLPAQIFIHPSSLLNVDTRSAGYVGARQEFLIFLLEVSQFSGLVYKYNIHPRDANFYIEVDRCKNTMSSTLR